MKTWCGILALAFWTLPARAQDAKPEGDAKVDGAITKAVGYLLKRQGPAGAIEDKQYPACQTATTSLFVMALMAVGHQPTDETPEGEALRKALDFVLRPDRQDAAGFFGGADGSRMYGHGITTLMLAEALGMGVDAAHDTAVRESCKKGVELILRAQAVKKGDPRMQGGWRYLPDSADADISASVWQMMALRAAKNAGLEVPKEAIAAAVAYVRRSYCGPRGADGTPAGPQGAFMYQPAVAPTYPMAAAGMVSLQVCGEYDAPEVKVTADWLLTQKLDYFAPWFLYGTYYYAQAMYQMGGRHAAEGRRNVEGMLLSQQNPDGSWLCVVESGYGRAYMTAMGILCLAVKYHYLPIYQR